MNIYFGCSLTGGRADEAAYGRIVDHLLAKDIEIPTAHLARPEVMALEKVIDARDVYERDLTWIEGCDALIAEVSTPSHGVGYELALALGMGKPVLACYKQGKPISKMITGNSQPNLSLLAYPDIPTLLEGIDQFIAALETD